MGIEPTSPAWQADTLTVVLHLHKKSIHPIATWIELLLDVLSEVHVNQTIKLTLHECPSYGHCTGVIRTVHLQVSL